MTPTSESGTAAGAAGPSTATDPPGSAATTPAGGGSELRAHNSPPAGPGSAATNLWCEECRGYGDHMTIRHPEPTPIPGCQGYARFDTLAQAEHVMNSSVEEFGGTWHVLGHDEHYHVGEVAHA